MGWTFDEGWIRLEGDVPASVDRKEVLRALARGVSATKRFQRVLVGGTRPAGAALVRARVVTSETSFGPGVGVAFTVVGPDERVLDEHPVYVTAVGGLMAELARSAERWAHVLADEGRWARLQEKHGSAGTKHPRVARLDPQSVLMDSVCVLQNGQVGGYENVARAALEAAAAARDPVDRRRLRFAAGEMLLGLGDGRGAREALARALLEDAPTDDMAASLRVRFESAWTQATLGDLFAPAIVAAGVGLAALTDDRRPEAFFRAAAALSMGGAPSLTATQAGIEGLLEQDGLANAVGARFGLCAGAAARAAWGVASLAGSCDDPRPFAGAIQAARPLLERAVGERALEGLEAALRGGDARSARALLEPAERLFAARDDLWDGLRALRERRYEDALRLLARDAARFADGHADAAAVRAAWLLGRIPEAIAAARRAVERGPRLAHAGTLLASLLTDVGEHDEAGEVVARALAEDPHDPQGLSCRAICRGWTGDLDGARADLEASFTLEGDGDPASAAYNVGTAAMRGGHLEAASRLLAQAANAPHAEPEWLVNHGTCLHRMGRHREAIRQLSAGVKRKPEIVHALAYRGLSKVALGERGEGRADLQAYLQHTPEGELADVVRAALGR